MMSKNEYKFTECVEKMEKLAKEMEFDILAHKPVSNHDDDWYLRIVFVKTKGEYQKYVTYTYNSTLSDNGSFNHGHYYSEFDYALEDFQERS